METLTQEQWSQVLAIVGPMMLSGTAMIGGATWYLSGRIERVRALASDVAELAPRVTDLVARMSAAEARITAVERLVSERFADETAYRSEIRSSLAALLMGRGHD